MIDNADFEEGEVDDLSDFDDGTIGDANVVYSQGDFSRKEPPSRAGVSRGDRRSIHRNKVIRGVNTAHKYRGRPAEPLLRLLPDDESGSRHKSSVVKRKRRKRDWSSVNVERPPSTKREKARCHFHLEGRCNKGSECPFSHGFVPTKKQELCKFYATGVCGKGSTCPFLHEEFPCKFYHMSKNCYHGSNCKFSHKPLTPSARFLLDKLADERNRTPRSVEKPFFNREASTQLPQGILAEPYGDVDYRHMLHSGLPSVGAPPNASANLQPLPQDIGRRSPSEPHSQLFRRPVDECRSRPPSGHGGHLPFRGPFPSPYRFSPRLPCPPLISGSNHEPPMSYSPPRFRPPYYENGGGMSFNHVANDDDYPSRQCSKDLKGQKPNPSSQPSPINNQHDIPPKMSVSKDVIVYGNEESNKDSSSITFKWHIIPLEIDKTHRQLPPSAANDNLADPRLKARPQLPILLSIPSISTEEKPPEAKNLSHSERRKRPKLTLNEMANTFARTGHRVQSKTPVLYSNILDPRLLKQKIDSGAASPKAAAEEGQTLTPRSLRVVFSP